MGTRRRHELTHDDVDRLRRLRLAWLRDVVSAAEQLAAPTAEATADTPRDRLAVALSAEVDRWLQRRGATHRSLGTSRRTLARLLRGESVTTESISDIADALDCDAVIQFRPRDGDRNGAIGAIGGASPCASGSSERTVDADASTTARTPADTPLDHEE
jgi:hypothetical protein